MFSGMGWETVTGTQFTCFTGTKAQILTLQEQGAGSIFIFDM